MNPMKGLARENQLGETSLVIPATLTVTPQFSRQEAMSVVTAQFEAPSQITRLDPGAFQYFSSLVSICIPASVEFLAKNCFVSNDGDINSVPSSLMHLTFEPGSELREIEPGALSGCLSLREFCIPASVEKLTGLSLPPSDECVLHVEDGNHYFHRAGDFVMSSDHRCLVRYFGAEPDLEIADEIEKIDDGCFRCCEITAVRFGPGSRLTSIGVQAFFLCDRINMICIPSPVTFLGDYCFDSCESLETVLFCADSKLEAIRDAAFSDCESLTSIMLPSSVRIIAKDSFRECEQLQNSPIPVDSELVRIVPGAFGGCWELQSMSLPSTVAVIGARCFAECRSLSRLTFDLPSHLRELLSLPPGLSRSAAIPDSVEILPFVGPFNTRADCALTFGPDSRLTDIDVSSSRETQRSPLFLRVSNRSLKRFRWNWEFTLCP
jgi:hypothetical protein